MAAMDRMEAMDHTVAMGATARMAATEATGLMARPWVAHIRSFGLQTSAQAIAHVAGNTPINPDDVAESAFNSSDNMGDWAPFVRDLLYTNAYLSNFGWTTDAGTKSVDLTLTGVPFLRLKRPSKDTFVEQLSLIHDYQDQRSDRAAEILSQLGSLADYYGFILGLTASRNPHTYELIGVAHTLAGYSVSVAKHVLACRRPDHLDATIMPMIPTPGHGSFPSGHATQAFTIATVLKRADRRTCRSLSRRRRTARSGDEAGRAHRR